MNRLLTLLFLYTLLAPTTVIPAQTTVNPPQQSISEKIAADANKLDINTATAMQLKALPGINEALAARIIAGRPYAAKNQLLRRGIITQETYNSITNNIIARRPKATAAK